MNTMVGALFPKLLRNQQKGSKPRCHLLTSGTASEVAARLTALIAPWGEVRSSDRWMPSGFEQCEEAQLHSADELIPDPEIREALLSWWLTCPSHRSKTPNLDIASTCTVQGKNGLLLVEAKAHDVELRVEERGKPLGSEDGRGISASSFKNHVRIGASIEEASIALSDETKLAWTLSRDRHYQMSNRFAWAWKLTELGIPIILLYLGFTDCEEMRERERQHPILSSEDWEEMVRVHSRPLFPFEIWNREWCVNGRSLIPIIKTTCQPLTC